MISATFQDAPDVHGELYGGVFNQPQNPSVGSGPEGEVEILCDILSPS